MKEILALLRGRLFTLRCTLSRPNIEIGRGLRLYGPLVINARGKVVMGENCRVMGLEGSTRRAVFIDVLDEGARVAIGRDVTLCAARIASRFDISIGDGVIIEDASIVDTDFHTLDSSRSTPADENLERCRITIGHRVVICAQSFITKGVEIGEEALVAPCAVVTKSVRPHSLVYGNPAVVLNGPQPGSKEAMR